jgi:hypothetical protein
MKPRLGIRSNGNATERPSNAKQYRILSVLFTETHARKHRFGTTRSSSESTRFHGRLHRKLRNAVAYKLWNEYIWFKAKHWSFYRTHKRKCFYIVSILILRWRTTSQVEAFATKAVIISQTAPGIVQSVSDGSSLQRDQLFTPSLASTLRNTNIHTSSLARCKSDSHSGSLQHTVCYYSLLYPSYKA